jgi:mannosyltransferase OCH1-like enzyme
MIPNLIHQLWTGEKDRYVDAWSSKLKALHPGWDFKVWSEGEGNTLVADGVTIKSSRPDVLDEISKMFSGKNAFRYRSSFWRVELLKQFGGVYLDSDVQVLRPLDAVLKDRSVVLSSKKSSVFKCAESFMACSLGHPFIEELHSKVDAKSIERLSLLVASLSTKYSEAVVLGEDVIKQDSMWRYYVARDGVKAEDNLVAIHHFVSCVPDDRIKHLPYFNLLKEV